MLSMIAGTVHGPRTILLVLGLLAASPRVAAMTCWSSLGKNSSAWNRRNEIRTHLKSLHKILGEANSTRSSVDTSLLAFYGSKMVAGRNFFFVHPAFQSSLELQRLVLIGPGRSELNDEVKNQALKLIGKIKKLLPKNQNADLRAITSRLLQTERIPTVRRILDEVFLNYLVVLTRAEKRALSAELAEQRRLYQGLADAKNHREFWDEIESILGNHVR